jgi:7-carboxy-7-deazaguanine synthase
MDHTSSHLLVTEIFHSIQGESTFAGQPCVFVRLTGCSLRCNRCDTSYAFSGGQPMTVEKIIQEVQRFQSPLVEITGGEPLDQPETFSLISHLCDQQLTVLIETGGAIDIAPVDPRAHVILDVKCPGSGMTHRMHWANLESLSEKDEAKFVIKDRLDYDWAVNVVRTNRLADRCTVLFSPVFEELSLQSLAEWILHDRLPIRFQVQLHKYIWDPQMRGV